MFSDFENNGEGRREIRRPRGDTGVLRLLLELGEVARRLLGRGRGGARRGVDGGARYGARSPAMASERGGELGGDARRELTTSTGRGWGQLYDGGGGRLTLAARQRWRRW